MNEEPFIYIGDLRVEEPMTSLTDLLVAGICIYLFIRLIRNYPSTKARTFFSIFFIGLGTGTMLGGLLGHAFLYCLHPAWQLPGWLISMAATSFLVTGSVEVNRTNINQRLLIPVIIINLACFLVMSIIIAVFIDFIYVAGFIALNLLGFVLVLHISGWLRSSNAGHLFFVGGVASMILVAFIFLLKLSFNQWINQNSLSHVLMAVSAFLFYLGARRF